MTETFEKTATLRVMPRSRRGEEQTAGPGRERLYAAGGIVGAVLASSCCIVPLLLVMLGMGGAWAGSLTALLPYKPYFLGATAILLGAGFWHVYLKPKPTCADGTFCARPAAGWITKATLWTATIVALLAASITIWAPWLY